jgi:hypothetical protein
MSTTPESNAPPDTAARHAEAIRLHRHGELGRAIAEYRFVLEQAPSHPRARRDLCTALLEAGRTPEAYALLLHELTTAADGWEWLNQTAVEAMTLRDLGAADALVRALAGFELGSRWYDGGLGGISRRPPDVALSLTKLRHDLQQFRHLAHLANGRVGSSLPLDRWIPWYEAAVARLVERGAGEDERLPLDDPRMVDVYGRLVHIRPTLRVAQALGPGWSRGEVERLYVEKAPGIVVIDGFLADEALRELRSFCLESTLFHRNRYAQGRLGSLFFGGFGCPLVMQIAEELREQLPGLLPARYPLRQIWAFKNTRPLAPGTTLHADFAAVNVNFWITPEWANRDPGRGGMVIYGVDAPLHWSFRDYNERLDQIRAFLVAHRAGHVYVPYRENRAVIFNSDLFHATDAVDFDPSYEGHRINVTMLFGDRAMDAHHPVDREPRARAGAPPSAWRSQVFRTHARS